MIVLGFWNNCLNEFLVGVEEADDSMHIFTGHTGKVPKKIGLFWNLFQCYYSVWYYNIIGMIELFISALKILIDKAWTRVIMQFIGLLYFWRGIII